MIQYRKSLFETNSSSTHSLIINDKYIDKLDVSDIQKLITKTTLTIPSLIQNQVSIGGTNKYMSTEQKLIYLITWLLIKEKRSVLVAGLNKSFTIKYNDEEVSGCERTKKEFLEIFRVFKLLNLNVDVIVIPSFNDPIIWDHQTTPLESKFPIDLTNKYAIIMYLFDENIHLYVENTLLIEKQQSIPKTE